jgi:multidrug efflux pump subunit AcrB
LEQLPLFVSNNRQIRLGDVAKIEEGQTPGEISGLINGKFS